MIAPPIMNLKPCLSKLWKAEPYIGEAWLCSGRGLYAVAPTPAQAYSCWHAKVCVDTPPPTWHSYGALQHIY